MFCNKLSCDYNRDRRFRRNGTEVRMREKGKVVDVTDGVARVAMDASQHAQCGSCGTCKSSAGGKQMLLDAAAPPGLRAADDVTVEISQPGPARSAALLLLVPLLLFVGGVTLGEWLRGREILPGGSGMSALAGFALMCLWYVGIGLYDRHLRRSPEHQPRIVSWPRRGEAG